MKFNQKIFATLLTVILFVTMSGSFVQAAPLEVEIRTPSTWGNSNMMLNCYTSSRPVSGTQVSTWKRSDHSTQLWGYYKLSGGKRALRPVDNLALALNANRSYEGTVCNVITSATNYFNDYALNLVDYGMVGEANKIKIELPARSGHKQKVYVTNCGNYQLCRWKYASSSNQYWYMEWH